MMEKTTELVFGSGRNMCVGKVMAFLELNKIFVEVSVRSLTFHSIIVHGKSLPITLLCADKDKASSSLRLPDPQSGQPLNHVSPCDVCSQECVDAGQRESQVTAM